MIIQCEQCKTKYKLADELINMDSFGASAPASQLFEKFGFTADAILAKI